jgi:hypothetical protein
MCPFNVTFSHQWYHLLVAVLLVFGKELCSAYPVESPLDMLQDGRDSLKPPKCCFVFWGGVQMSSGCPERGVGVVDGSIFHSKFPRPPLPSPATHSLIHNLGGALSTASVGEGVDADMLGRIRHSSYGISTKGGWEQETLMSCWVSVILQKGHLELPSLRFEEEPIAKLKAYAIQSKRWLVQRPRWRGETRLIRVKESISVDIPGYIRFISLFFWYWSKA